MTISMLRLLMGLILGTAACGAPPGETSSEEQPSQPATTGLDSAIMEQTIEDAAQLPQLRSLIVLRHGRTLAERRFNGGPPLDEPVNIKSASKAVLSALVGIAIERGILTGTDQPVLSVLGNEAPARPDPHLARVTVGHLLSMQAGLERTSGPNYGRWVSSPNWVRYALSRDFVDEPGGRMLYSTGSSHLLSAMLTRASRASTHALAQSWLGEPLGIRIPPWPQDPQGIYFGGNDMLLSPRGLARFGELYRQGGSWDGRQIIPSRWIEESWRERTISPWSGHGYGYGWFIAAMRGHPVRFAWGYGGQLLYVIPSLELTVVMISDPNRPERDGGHIDALHALLANGIIPAAEKGERSSLGH